MITEEIAEKAHSMNPQDYKIACLTFYSHNKEELHEIVQACINTLSYNASWDFEIFEEFEELEYKTVLIFKYNGTICGLNAIQKLNFGYYYRLESKW